MLTPGTFLSGTSSHQITQKAMGFLSGSHMVAISSADDCKNVVYEKHAVRHSLDSSKLSNPTTSCTRG